jgi:hypothetical protein
MYVRNIFESATADGSTFPDVFLLQADCARASGRCVWVGKTGDLTAGRTIIKQCDVSNSSVYGRIFSQEYSQRLALWAQQELCCARLFNAWLRTSHKDVRNWKLMTVAQLRRRQKRLWARWKHWSKPKHVQTISDVAGAVGHSYRWAYRRMHNLLHFRKRCAR